MTLGSEVYSCMQQLWYMTEKIRWWGWAPRNLFKITCLRAMALPREYEWRSEINAIAFPSSLDFSLTLSLRYLFAFRSVSAQPLQFLCQTWQIQSEGGYRWIWLPSLSSLMPGCKKIIAVCSAVWDGKGQLVNQPVFLPSEFISIKSSET